MAAFDLALLDLHMPDMDGLEVAALLRRTKGGRSVPIVAVTADTVEEAARKVAAAGIQGCVTKPVVFEELLGTMRAAL